MCSWAAVTAIIPSTGNYINEPSENLLKLVNISCLPEASSTKFADAPVSTIILSISTTQVGG